ncbi:hypothetical protein EUTSA_v10021266mg [Eutrema salsugineum]|uniref:holo-[acyl-carrier-protein] synthase n=1 Tax=Eutrema salsugineum TaxID=72664 RepID=V4LDA4_EUTSA|nr:uncharacterized protein LOC18023242 [Eutrema salsugineum]ESQ48435.1 hypothetical protein EUTSA_v10021266mg [Eutrema salsugineum]
MRIGTMLSSLTPLQLPSRMQTHLWYIIPNQVKSESLLKHYSELLSPSEKGKVFRMQSDELNKKNVLLARTLVRTTIARYQSNNNTVVVDPRSLKFKKNLYGKPEVDLENDTDNPKLQFNISHTDSLIACGVTVNVPVGIDVEDKTRKMKHDVLALAKRFYSPEEVNFLSTIADTEAQRKEFIKLWTLKEAYVKALGKGFSASPFNTFTINQAEAGAKESYNLCQAGERIGEWKLALLDLAASSHYAAICIEDDDDDAKGVEAPMNVIVHRTIPFVEDELISDWKLL